MRSELNTPHGADKTKKTKMQKNGGDSDSDGGVRVVAIAIANANAASAAHAEPTPAHETRLTLAQDISRRPLQSLQKEERVDKALSAPQAGILYTHQITVPRVSVYVRAPLARTTPTVEERDNPFQLNDRAGRGHRIAFSNLLHHTAGGGVRIGQRGELQDRVGVTTLGGELEQGARGGRVRCDTPAAHEAAREHHLRAQMPLSGGALEALGGAQVVALDPVSGEEAFAERAQPIGSAVVGGVFIEASCLLMVDGHS